MNIRKRLYGLTMLNIAISLGIGGVGYFGLESLHPDNTRATLYANAWSDLNLATAMNRALYADVTRLVASSKAPELNLGTSAQLVRERREHFQTLNDALKSLASQQLPKPMRDAVEPIRVLSDAWWQSGSGLIDAIQSNDSRVANRMESFESDFANLSRSLDSMSRTLREGEDAERQALVAWGHRLQTLMVVALILGVGAVFSSLAFTLRSILTPIREVITALGSCAGEVDTSAQRMSERSGELSQSATEQAAAVQQSIASMTEMSSMIAQTSDSSAESLANIRRMAERTEDGNRVMERLASSTEAINQANIHLREMVDIIAEISAKTSVINEIVFKTQLLSFNASIEAARAGQHGRGFAVVAEEFGTLAEISGQAAKEIQALLETSRKHVVEIVDMTNQRVSDGQTVSKEALSIFNEISREINHITKQIQRITDATREQQVGVQQTSTAMNQMDQAAQRNSLLAGETLRSASELSGHSRKLTSIMTGLLNLTSLEQLTPDVAGFSTSSRNGRSLGAPTKVVELDDDPGVLDHTFLHEASMKLAERGKVAIKGDIRADDENFQPYNGQGPR